MSNGKTYTEVLLEVYAKIDTVEQRVTGKLDAVIRDNSEFKAGLAKGEARFDSLDNKIDGKGGLAERVDTNASDIKSVRNLNAFIALIGSAIAGFIGTQK